MATSGPDARRPLVYATVLYWQTRELPLVERCIESLLRQADSSGIDLRIIVIDNGCGRTPRLPVEPSIDLIHLPENRGFSGGHNAGMRQAMAAGADYLLLFNSDAVADPGCVRELVAEAQGRPSGAFFGPLILHEAESDSVESAGQSFNVRTARHRELGRGQLATTIGAQPRSVDALSGCVLLARGTAVEEIGLLDESLFIYFEDMDWSLRARAAGYDVVLVPRARVHHLGGGSTQAGSPLSTFYSVRNHMVVASRYGRCLPGPLLKVLALAYHVAFLARSPEYRTRRRVAALAEGARAAWGGRMGAWARSRRGTT